MIYYNKSKKGATLIELTVVLAVISIISTMVVSFSIFLSTRVKTTLKANDLIQDISSIRSTTESWINSLTLADANFSVFDSNLTANVNGTEYSLTLNDNLLSAPLPSGENLSCSIYLVDDVVFSIKTNLANTDVIYICKAVYTVDNSAHVFSFTINPFIGDLVKGG